MKTSFENVDAEYMNNKVLLKCEFIKMFGPKETQALHTDTGPLICYQVMRIKYRFTTCLQVMT